jgi:hypothetical protein
MKSLAWSEWEGGIVYVVACVMMSSTKCCSGAEWMGWAGLSSRYFFLETCSAF